MTEHQITGSPHRRADSREMHEPFRILIADDEAAVLDIYRRVLLGTEVTQQSDSELAALEAELFNDYEPATSSNAGPDKKDSKSDSTVRTKQEPSRHPYELILCTQGDEAVDEVRKARQEGRPIAVGFIDVRMPPGPDGIWAAEKIREIDPNIQLMIVTGYSDRNPAEFAHRIAPADKLFYIQKPFHGQELTHFAWALTAKWLSERTLRETEERLKTVLDSVQAGIVTIDIETHVIVDANPYAVELIGAPREEIVGAVCHRHICPAEHGKCPITDLGQRVDISDRVLLKADGTEVPVIKTVSPVKLGNREYLIETFIDITEKRKVDAQLQQAQRLESLGTLAGGIAHDFNNLLMGIQGNVSLMLMDMDSIHHYHKRLMTIEKQVQSGSRLTSHLLGYARKGKYEVKPVDLNNLVRETSDTFGRTKKDLSIYRELAEDLLAIEADPGQIEQVLLNLLVNAADAMPGGGDLILKTFNVTHNDIKNKLYDPKPGNYVLLTVSDTGTGMDKETMERIFDPFFTTKEMGRGTGLGLASSYGIIKAHGGYIDAESKKGQGTTFSICLPASEKEIQQVVKTAERVIEGTGTVLLVDDEEVIREVGRDLLKAMGYRVLIARDGKEALEVYRKNRDDIEIVILDMVMPNMGGGEAYDRMKEIDPNVKVLLSSGYSIDGEATEILGRGCDDFIQKPFNMKELSAKIREILGKG